MGNLVEEVLDTILERLEEISKSKTVLGDPIEADGVTIVPVTKVNIGFGAGGGEGNTEEETGSGGGGGGGASVQPVAFIVIQQNEVELYPVKQKTLKGIVEAIPNVLEKVKKMKDAKEETESEE